MKKTVPLLPLVLVFSSTARQGPIRVVAESAVLWGEERPWAHSTTVKDPLTGHALRRINTDSAEVSSSVAFSQTRAAWESYSIFAVATVIVTNTQSEPIEVSGSTQTLEFPPEKYFKKGQIACSYVANWDSPRKKNSEPFPAEVKASILMFVHMSGVPDNVPEASNIVGAPVHGRYSVKVNGVDFVFPVTIPTNYAGDYLCRPAE